MITAWHFRAVADKLRDGSPSRPGEVEIYTGKVILCERGLHASRRLIDALTYAPGPYLARVECDGEVIEAADKLVCTQRRPIWIRDVSSELKSFARWCAREEGLVWVEEMDLSEAAWNSAECTARSAAGSAAGSAACAAWSAARGAAWSAAESAAWSAAESAAYSAAGSAARSAQNDQLEKMMGVG